MTDWNSQIVKLTQLEHVLARPDSYVGSVETATVERYVGDHDREPPCKKSKHDGAPFAIVLKRGPYNAALYKIADEILSNCGDHAQRTKDLKGGLKLTKIDVTVHCSEYGPAIEVVNNGQGIAI